MFSRKEPEKKEPIVEEPQNKGNSDLPTIKPFADMTHNECVRLYSYYLSQIERDCSAKDYDVTQFPTGTGQNIINIIRPQSYQYYAFVGVFGESCGFIAYDRVLERYVFLKLALSRFSPRKGTALTQIWSINDYSVEFTNPFQKRWSRGSRIQFGLYHQLIRDRIIYFTIPSIQASLHPGFFLEMDYIHGMGLMDWTQDKPIGKVLQMFYKILHAVNYLHSYRVIHRDLKPDNIRIEVSEENDRFDRPVLLDFGMAKVINTSNEKTKDDITCIGFAIGNPLFRSPTQEEDSARATYRDDIYTLGLVLWTIIHKAIPKVKPGYDLKNRHSRQNWLNEMKHDLAPILQPIFGKATETDDSKRYQTIEQFLKDFTIALNTLEIPIPKLNETENELFAEQDTIIIDKSTIVQPIELIFNCFNCPYEATCGIPARRIIGCNEVVKLFNFLKTFNPE
jgi:serine/threonine protein kinase